MFPESRRTVTFRSITFNNERMKMTTTLFLLFLTILDFQHPPIPDSIEKQFVVTELVDQTTTGCATNPSSGGGLSNHFIEVDYVNHNDPHDSAMTVSALPADYLHNATDTPVVPVMRPHDPSGKPEKPLSEKSPVAVVPEPPTAAILTVSAIVLLFFLFGRRKKERLYRRT